MTLQIPDWLLAASLQGGGAAAVFLCLRWILGRRIGARWCHAMWLLVALRLVLPALPQSRFSSQNLSAMMSAESNQTAAAKAAIGSCPGFSETSPDSLPVVVQKPGWDWAQTAGLVWISGALLLLARLLRDAARVRHMIAAASRVESPEILMLLDRCREDMQISIPVALVECDALTMPALAGWFSPVICLPRELAATLAPCELRFIFLHELAHVKRRDIALNWVLALLQAFHWFNPFVWRAFACCRADRELLCDALVLGRTPRHERAGYGNVLLKLMSRHRSRPASSAGFIGIHSHSWEMKRRIQMIVDSRKPSVFARTFAAAIIALTASMALTAKEDAAGDPVDARGGEAGTQVLIDTRILELDESALKTANKALKESHKSLSPCAAGAIADLTPAERDAVMNAIQKKKGALLSMPRIMALDNQAASIEILSDEKNYIAGYERNGGNYDPVIKSTPKPGVVLNLLPHVSADKHAVTVDVNFELRTLGETKQSQVEVDKNIRLTVEEIDVSITKKAATLTIASGENVIATGIAKAATKKSHASAIVLLVSARVVETTKDQ